MRPCNRAICASTFVAASLALSVPLPAGAVVASPSTAESRESGQSSYSGSIGDTAVDYGVEGYTEELDYPHISTSDGPRAVSVHGWWQKVSGPATSATVTVELEAKGPNDMFFHTVGKQTLKAVAPGGGRGNRATARVECKDKTPTRFRGKVDIDINHYVDPANKKYGKEVTLNCGV